MFFIIVAIILVLFFIVKHNKTESFSVNKPELYNQIIKHQELFEGQNYSKLKSKIPLMDASIYSDVKSLKIDKKLITHETLKTLI